MATTNIAITTNIEITTDTVASTTITINLRDFYTWYTHDEYVEVSGEIAAELLADKRYHKAHDRRMKRNKSYSLDFEADMDAAAVACHSDNPEYIFTMMERYCNLCQALNSLPEIQGRRIEAHFLQGKSRKEIARAEGVCERAVNTSIERGLRAMKKYFSNTSSTYVPKCPQSDLYI